MGPCEGYETAVCITYHGGLYDESASSSSQKQASVAAAGGASDTTSGTEPDCITDILELSANFSEPSFPLGLVRQEPGTAGGPLLNQLGLGPNSTILNALKDSGKIASRSWSFYDGRTGATADQQANGTFVLGGFDASKVPANGKNYTKQLTSSSEQCGTGMQLTLSNIQMQYPNGSSYSLYGDVESTSLEACLGSGPLAMYIPYDNFVEFTDICDCYTQNRSFGIHYYGMLYESPEPVYVTSKMHYVLHNVTDSIVAELPPVSLSRSTAKSTSRSTTLSCSLPTSISDRTAKCGPTIRHKSSTSGRSSR